MESNLTMQELLVELFSSDHNRNMNIMWQTLVYGIYLCLVPVAIHAMVTNGLQTRARKWHLVIITFMFALMTMYWILSITFTFLVNDSLNKIVAACYGSDDASSCLVGMVGGPGIPLGTWIEVFGDTLLVNYLIADAVVIWRAWVLCSDQSKVVLMTPVVMLAINTVIYLMTVTARVIQVFSENPRMFSMLIRIADITQLVQLMVSWFINIFSTSIIALKAWKYRKSLMESGAGIRTPRLAIKILAVLVESGMIYVLIGATTLGSIVISLTRLQLSEIPTVITLVDIQLAGIYPIVVVLLVEKNRSLNSTYLSFGTIIDVRGDGPSQAEPASFTPGPVLASGGQKDLATKHDADIQVTFGSTLEPGTGGMHARNSEDSNSDEEHATY